MKPSYGDLVKVIWNDIQSDSSWTQEEHLEPAVCVSYGFFNGFKDKCIRLYSSYNEHEIGDRTVIPKSVIRDIIIVKRNEREIRAS